MPEQNEPMGNIVKIALAYEATTMLGVKYLNKFNEIMDDLKAKGGYSTMDEMFAMAYLHGLIDMSQVNASIASGRDVEELDEHLMRVFDDMFTGRYWRGEEGDAGDAVQM